MWVCGISDAATGDFLSIRMQIPVVVSEVAHRADRDHQVADVVEMEAAPRVVAHHPSAEAIDPGFERPIGAAPEYSGIARCLLQDNLFADFVGKGRVMHPLHAPDLT